MDLAGAGEGVEDRVVGAVTVNASVGIVGVLITGGRGRDNSDGQSGRRDIVREENVARLARVDL